MNASQQIDHGDEYTRADILATRGFSGWGGLYVAEELPVDVAERIAGDTWLEMFCAMGVL